VSLRGSETVFGSWRGPGRGVGASFNYQGGSKGSGPSICAAGYTWDAANQWCVDPATGNIQPSSLPWYPYTCPPGYTSGANAAGDPVCAPAAAAPAPVTLPSSGTLVVPSPTLQLARRGSSTTTAFSQATPTAAAAPVPSQASPPAPTLTCPDGTVVQSGQDCPTPAAPPGLPAQGAPAGAPPPPSGTTSGASAAATLPAAATSATYKQATNVRKSTQTVIALSKAQLIEKNGGPVLLVASAALGVGLVGILGGLRG